jgi:predicted DNA-binding protein (MmcQ/YjbR family)
MTIDSIRDFCLALPGVTEDIKWGHDLCFSVGAKMFCVTGLEEGPGVSFKVTDDQFDEMVTRPGIIPAPYMARNKWVLVNASDSLSQAEWKQFILQSYQLVRDRLPKKIRESL